MAKTEPQTHIDNQMLELMATVSMVIENMKTSESSRITRRDLGYKISAFYNHAFHIRLDLVRLDKAAFFL